MMMPSEILSNKKLEYYLSLPYSVELMPDEDGSWFARILLLDGCITTGADAQRGWLITALELGIDLR